MDAAERLQQVVDLPSFIAFVHALQAEYDDLETRAGWENITIAAYLEAAAAWAVDAPMQLPPSAAAAGVWRSFAQFLYAGKIYE